ncbi:MAG TPA: DsbA family oxidoreductase [Natronosporangium sp.]|jgi:predicted DsbA family dithiol-disulfide isomerase|nr:DsbA family oxidoreductase [Natronosporangium sp.]
MTSPPPLEVRIWVDIACPWCFIGKRRFERGAREYGGELRVEYHSFELAPDTPVDFAGSEVDFLADYKGLPRAQVQQMLDQVTAIAAGEGLRYDFAALRHTNTLLAHQALQYAKEQDRQRELLERLFQAYFEQGRHLGKVDELAALAAEVGLDGDALRQALIDRRYESAVRQDIDTARRLGITGVPFYVIDRRYGVSGAQPPEVFASALTRAAATRVEEEGAA